MRSDARRNRDTVLTAAHTLFDRSGPEGVSMADVAAAAGVGKGTVFRRFKDRVGLMSAIFADRLQPLREAVEHGPSPLGPAAAPEERLPAVVLALLQAKLDHLGLCAELDAGCGSIGPQSTDPFLADHYTWAHRALRESLVHLHGPAEADWTAHVLLASIRADLMQHLILRQGLTAEDLKKQVRGHVDRLMSNGTGCAPVRRSVAS
ncbi:TetR/AcrR family transcriptional regulator [Streptomyces sp. NPDC050704]|uniref:TetR/AcrR family transcriptional regulator n=1 Tax=Streptomyces sp. NPDC050704 TaxID=3157219 RepID=UPI003438EDB5